jgi:hypothetical protein
LVFQNAESYHKLLDAVELLKNLKEIKLGGKQIEQGKEKKPNIFYLTV